MDKLIYEGKDTLVYQGYSKRKKESVILKTVSSERVTLRSIEKLKNEYEIAQRINCVKGVLEAYALENWDGRPVLVKEYFEGDSLKNLIKNKDISIEKFFEVAIQLVDILNDIHKNKIVHLDINPNNILINVDGEVRIIDFNSSMIMIEDNKNEKNPEQLEGTLEYISPEQTGRIGKLVDYRSDYYSLGICFYQLLTGKLPFNNSDRIELIYAHIAKKAIPPIVVNDRIPQVISNIIMKLIAKMPEDRYQSLIGLKRDLERCKESFKSNHNIENFEIAQEDINDRFEISPKLYGREEEIKELLASVERVGNGSKELLLIKGYSGIGKTALVNKIQNEILGSSAYFICGKFEQLQSETPYNAIIQALEKFIHELLMESSEQLQIWRKKILRAVGNNGQVLVDVLPSLKLIIGEQEPVPELGSMGTQNRFNLIIENFMKVIAEKEHPLIMFIDDLQWADIASLNFIKTLMTNEAIENLLIIGAYRDNEVNSLHPVNIMKNELINNKANVNIIELKSLKEKEVQALLEDTLTSSRKESTSFKELSDFIYSKTAGNCFFMREFLKILYDKKYIWFDYQSMQWCWDTEEIKKMDITENVVDLLIQKINTLNPSTVEELKNAACIGNQFDLRTLTLVSNKSSEGVLEELQVAADKGLVSILKNESMDLSKDNIKFRFLHDRIQQAVYALIPKEMKPAAHLHIGKLLLKEYLHSEKTEQLFETVRQLNAGRTIISETTERIKLAELNLKAGMAAKSSSAYKAAFVYFETGIKMLSNDSWKKYYDMTLKLYSEITEMSYLIGDFEKMEQYSRMVLDNAKTVIDKVKVYNVELQAYQSQFKIQEALNISISVLKEMDIDIPIAPTQADIESAFANLKEAMSGMEVEELVNLPVMKEPIKLAAMQILAGSISVTYKTAPMLTPIVVCKMMELSLKYGNAPLSAMAYASYGMILSSSGIDINLAYKLGKMSCALIESQKLKQYKPMVLNIYSGAIQQWKEHLRLTLNPSEEVYYSGMENGDFEYAGYGLLVYSKNAIYLGESLKELEKKIKINIERLRKIKQGVSSNWISIFGQFVLNMQGKSNTPTKLIGELCDENSIIDIISNNGDIVTKTYLLVNKMMLNYYFQRYSSAIECGEKVGESIKGLSGLLDEVIYIFFDSLSRLAVYSDASDKEKEEILIRILQNQDKMKKWAENAPMNFLHKFYLVEAEQFRVLGKTDEAIKCYDKAISLAKENEYINDEALANELATKFWLSKNNYRYAKLHFKESYSCYKRWGAESKVKDLQNKYLQIFHEKFEGNIIESQTTILELVDIAAIMKASQAISQEIVLEKLIKTLIKIVIENLGAQKVVFIVKEKDNLIIKGKKESEQEKITVGLNIKVEEYGDIPKSIINYVSRTIENVILENAIDSTKFGNDKYIVKNKSKSVLCYPLINQGEFKGIIYVENNLMRGAFTKDRLKVLEILSAQIVIALENAKLYEKLELSNVVLDNKVKERTLELKEERDRLQKYLDIAEVSILVLDKDDKITLINRKGCEILGYCEAELHGKQWSEFISKKEHKEENNDVQTLISGELVRYSEKIVTTKNGEERMICCYNVTLRDKYGKEEGTLSCGVDVTEYNLLREQLEYNKLKLELLANLSHELKTPLNLSFCALQMLNLYLNNNLSSEANEKFEKYTKVIKQNNYRLLKLVNNIVDITRINSNSFELNLKNNDIVEFISKITYSVSDYVKNKNRRLKFNSNIKNKVIACDPFNIERVMLNLLSNAIKFTDEGDEISVNIYDKEDSISIVVRDTGIGIPRDKQKMIFERFRQVDKSFTRNSEGSGIGLTIVKLLVKLHNGNITVESKDGEFTEFTINLPSRKLDYEEDIAMDNYNEFENNLIDRIDIEFSDVYGL
ncbi:AAA family ATPase [Clostridium ganghwense]|nr:AAA family ATPase [Clostridium ganghwense]